MKKVVENAQYATLALLIIAQCVVGGNFYLGQGIYLAANVISVFRCFVLERPSADDRSDASSLPLPLDIIITSYHANKIHRQNAQILGAKFVQFEINFALTKVPNGAIIKDSGRGVEKQTPAARPHL